MRKIAILLLIALSATAVSCHAADLLSYVNQPDPAYQWSKASGGSSILGSSYVLNLTSQTWQGITWKHQLEVIRPAKPDYPRTAILLITFGKPGGETSAAGAVLAAASGCPVAILYDIPNQPLFTNLKEDALIAYTFAKTMETGDLSWPLLFPMTKASVRAMDALQEFSRSEFGEQITGFVVSGASKRGWTTWMTAAADPARVKAIVPMVYDNLNLAVQMPLQIRRWGAYSASIHDYTDLGIQDKMNTEAGRRLTPLVDPWTYRSRITMPKLIVNGTNDPYWVLDALNVYWDGVKSPKYVTYVPNAGHGLSGKAGEGLMRAAATSAAFARAIAAGAALPGVTWNFYSSGKDTHKLDIRVNPEKATANLWTAASDTQDFRKSAWESAPMKSTKEGFSATVPLPAKGYKAVFGDITMPLGDRSWTVSTQIRILNPEGVVKAEAPAEPAGK